MPCLLVFVSLAIVSFNLSFWGFGGIRVCVCFTDALFRFLTRTLCSQTHKLSRVCLRAFKLVFRQDVFPSLFSHGLNMSNHKLTTLSLFTIVMFSLFLSFSLSKPKKKKKVSSFLLVVYIDPMHAIIYHALSSVIMSF